MGVVGPNPPPPPPVKLLLLGCLLLRSVLLGGLLLKASCCCCCHPIAGLCCVQLHHLSVDAHSAPSVKQRLLEFAVPSRPVHSADAHNEAMPMQGGDSCVPHVVDEAMGLVLQVGVAAKGHEQCLRTYVWACRRQRPREDHM